MPMFKAIIEGEDNLETDHLPYINDLARAGKKVKIVKTKFVDFSIILDLENGIISVDGTEVFKEKKQYERFPFMKMRCSNSIGADVVRKAMDSKKEVVIKLGEPDEILYLIGWRNRKGDFIYQALVSETERIIGLKEGGF